MKVLCNNCGAEIDDHMAKCPYCDTMLPKGAEAEYMEKLYDIQEDMEALHKIPGNVVKAEMKYQGRRIKRIAVITVLIVLVFAVLFIWNDKKYERNVTEDYIWEQENFPIMSQLYENGEYEELLELFINASDEDRPVWNWDHYDEFMEWLEEQE